MIRLPIGLRGEEGLLLAIIGTAVNDVAEGNGHARDARDYLQSKLFEHHVALLGLNLSANDIVGNMVNYEPA
jgi:hypothetical protein